MAGYGRSRCRRGRGPGREAAAAVAAGIILAAIAHSALGRHPDARPGAQAAVISPGRRAVAVAIGYARAQLGKPYVWGGTGPGGFDCSGLVMMAYRAAGITLARTSEEQWAAGPQVPGPQPGDLVFFAGADGTPAAPGHVGLVIGRHSMIEAYASGYPVRVAEFGTPAAAPGDTSPVGFTAPWR